MSYEPWFVSSEQDALLDELLSQVRDLGPRSHAVLDLDGCLFDTRGRQVGIYREYAEAVGDARIATIRLDHFRCWDHARTLRNVGLGDEEAADQASELFAFWKERFFDPAYLALDAVMPGAPRFVRALAAHGGRITYLTGRVTGPTAEPTRHQLGRWRFPAVDGERVRLVTKDDPDLDDATYKERAYAALLDGPVPPTFALDNEPGHVNGWAEATPTARVVWMHTDHSPWAPEVRPDLPVLRSYLRRADLSGPRARRAAPEDRS